MTIKIDVEYCGTCGYANTYQELSSVVLERFPQVILSGHEGRRASFEVQLNGVLIHSKLNTMAFPDYENLKEIITDVYEGKEIRPVTVQQPITNCIIL